MNRNLFNWLSDKREISLNSSLLNNDKDNRFGKSTQIFVFSVATILLLSWIRGGIFYSSFNIDEVILFFTARGFFPNEIPEFAQALAPINKVFLVNRSGGSLDPGVFTLILRFWSLLGLETWWLRGLPMLFFLLGAYFYLESLKIQSKNLISSLMISTLFFSNDLMLDYAFTVRPYSMELCGGAFIFFTFIRNFHNPKIDSTRDLLTGLALAFFIGSRYSFSILLALAYTTQFLFIEKLRFKKLFIQIAPCLLMAIIYYFLSYRYQAKLLPLVYANDSFLRALSLYQFSHHFLNHKVWFFIASFLYWLLFKRGSSSESGVLRPILITNFLYLMVSLALDLLHISPIHFGERYSLLLQCWGIMVFGLILISEVEKLKKILTPRLSGYKKSTHIFIIFCFVSFFGHRMITFDFTQASDIVPILRTLEKEANWQQSVATGPITLAMIKFLKDFNKYPLDWTKMPQFRPLRANSNLDSDYYLTVYGAINFDLNKYAEKLEAKKDLKLVYPGHYHRLYKKIPLTD